MKKTNLLTATETGDVTVDFVNHLLLAYEWFEARGVYATELQATRLMYRMSIADLRRGIAEAASLELSAMLQGGK